MHITDDRLKHASNLPGESIPPHDILSSLSEPLRNVLRQIVTQVHHREDTGCRRFHKLLANLNQKRLSITDNDSPMGEHMVVTICTYLEDAWIKRLRLETLPWQIDFSNLSPESFVGWFESLRHFGPGQNHLLFLYLAERANWENFQYFIRQEMASEAGFDDLIAMTQLKASAQVKMELAHHFWDEMGEGHPSQAHTHLFSQVAALFQIPKAPGSIHWEALALSNLMVALATKRSRFFESIGALGVIELTAPDRCQKITEGLKRLNIAIPENHYYKVHSHLDADPWQGWKKNVILPLLAEYPEGMKAMAEGAIARLLLGACCYERYQQILGF